MSRVQSRGSRVKKPRSRVKVEGIYIYISVLIFLIHVQIIKFMKFVKIMAGDISSY